VNNRCLRSCSITRHERCNSSGSHFDTMRLKRNRWKSNG